MIAVQADGKVVVAAATRAGFGVLARLDRAGRFDRTFGADGFVVDPRSLPITAVAVQPDGKIIALDALRRLRRYEPDGSRDETFGEGGTAAAAGAIQGPGYLVLLPDGRIGVGGNFRLKIPAMSMAFAYVYSADGRQVEKAGELSPAGWMWALAAAPRGSLLMAGYGAADPGAGGSAGALLARFTPGSGGDGYDGSFAGGAGVAKIAYGDAVPQLNSLAVGADGALLAGGTVGGRPIAVRLSSEGALVPEFGEAGFAVAASSQGFAEGADASRDPSGRIFLAASLSSRPGSIRAYHCSACWTPAVAAFDGSGGVVAGFGTAGLSRSLPLPPAKATDVEALPDGGVLVAGELTGRMHGVGRFVGRLLPDGTPDTGFGDGGATTVLACPGSPATQRRDGCLPSARARLWVQRVGGGVRLRFTVRPNLRWATVLGVRLVLPPALRVGKRPIRVSLRGRDGSQHRVRISGRGRRLEGFWSTFAAHSLSLTAPPGALRLVRKVARRRRPAFRIVVSFGSSRAGYGAGAQRLVLRRPFG